MKVASVLARTVRIPLPQATAFATRQVADRYYTVVRVESTDGGTGLGFCYAGHAGGSVVTDAVRELLSPTVVGRDPFAVEVLWEQMYGEVLLHGRTGSVMRALSAIDIALWDHNARAVDLPLWRYLGGSDAVPVRSYASGGYYVADKGPAQLAEEVRGYVAQGFNAVKIKVGRLDAGADAERVAAAREAVGDDVLLMLDANNAWSELPSALRAVRKFEPYDPYWIEEPFSPDDVDNHVRLAKRTPVNVVTGEIEAGRWRHLDLLRRDASAILQTDAAVCGGITEWRRIAATAASHGVPMAPHWFHDLHAPLCAAIPNALFVEFFPNAAVLNFRSLLDRQLALDGGGLRLHQTPGLGFGLDEEALERWAIDEWR